MAKLPGHPNQKGVALDYAQGAVFGVDHRNRQGIGLALEPGKYGSSQLGWSDRRRKGSNTMENRHGGLPWTCALF